MKSSFKILLAGLAICNCPLESRAAELTEDQIKSATQGNVEAFESVEIASNGKPTVINIKLGESTAKVDDFVFDGFRFVAPDDLKGDFVWYFNAPNAWGQWYITPAKGKPEPAFRNWLDADKLYQPQDRADDVDRLRVLQTLRNDYFEAGREYIMWFRKVEGRPESDTTVRAVIGFRSLPEKEEWDHAKIEETLLLKPAPPADQVALLESRGGEILLDKQFFKPGYAAGRIDHVFWTIRQTVRMRSGFFITMKVGVPACNTDPLLSEIEEKYGKADFVREAEELKMKGAEVEDGEAIVTHYFDYFGLEVAKNDPEKRVVRVVAQANNFASLRPEGEATFGGLSMENLTVFHKSGNEVGRMYFFREGEKKVITIQEPPIGAYSNGPEKFEYFGEGKWAYTYTYESKVARHFRYEGHRLSGKSEAFYEDGKPYYVANYKGGLLHGELVEYSESGEETRTQFEYGEKVE